MWRFYTTLKDDGLVSERLRAEHTALTLFAVHQQSQSRPMHVRSVGLGRAVRALHSGPNARFSQEAVDRRFAAAAAATSMVELTMHLRGLVSQLHDIGQELDYTQLFNDLVAWQHPDRVGQVRRRWGSGYFVWKADPEANTDPRPEELT
jgi:CRISPR system Cascade subunit CasB